MREFDKQEYIDNLYDQLVEDFLCWNIDCISDSNLFFMIEKFWIEPILHKPIALIKQRRENKNKIAKNLVDNPF